MTLGDRDDTGELFLPCFVSVFTGILQLIDYFKEQHLVLFSCLYITAQNVFFLWQCCCCSRFFGVNSLAQTVLAQQMYHTNIFLMLYGIFCTNHISMAQPKVVVTPLLTLWNYHSLPLGHRSIFFFINFAIHINCGQCQWVALMPWLYSQNKWFCLIEIVIDFSCISVLIALTFIEQTQILTCSHSIAYRIMKYIS